MFLELSPTLAGGRFAFAAAAVTSSAIAHSEFGAMGVDLPSVIVAFFLLLLASWTTRNSVVLLGAALGSQVVLHFGSMWAAESNAMLIGAPHHVLQHSMQHTVTPSMLGLHAIASIVAWVLLWRFEVAWEGIARVVRAVVSAFTSVPIAAPRFVRACIDTTLLGLESFRDSRHVLRRGPPAFR